MNDQMIQSQRRTVIASLFLAALALVVSLYGAMTTDRVVEESVARQLIDRERPFVERMHPRMIEMYTRMGMLPRPTPNSVEELLEPLLSMTDSLVDGK